MNTLRCSLLVLLSVTAIGITAAYDATFDQFFTFMPFCQGQWNCQRGADGNVNMQIRYGAGGGFTSKNKFQYGMISMQMKLPNNYFGGIIPSFYAIDQPGVDYHAPHDEIDFEFFGQDGPGNTLISTNLLSGGKQFTEQFYFPFDPSADYHTYSLIWSPTVVIWVIDDMPIRATHKDNVNPFPSHPCTIQGTIWEAPWSPYKPNYNNGALVASYKNFMVSPGLVGGDYKKAWMNGLPADKVQQMNTFRNGHLKKPSGWEAVV